MKKNIGLADRVVRAVLGLGIIILGVIYGSRWGLIGLLPLLTATVGFCPLYTLLKINTCKK
jgi:hypothetical protein